MIEMEIVHLLKSKAHNCHSTISVTPYWSDQLPADLGSRGVQIESTPTGGI